MPLKLHSIRSEASDVSIVSPGTRWKHVLQLIRTSGVATKAQTESIIDILPVEILQNIVSFINTPADHAALCLTCKIFHSLALPGLLADVVIATRRDAVTYLRRCRQLAHEPNGPTVVKRITFTWPESSVASMGTYFDLSEVHRLPNLEEWIVNLPPRETIQCHGDKLYRKLISFRPDKPDKPDALPVREMYLDFGVRSTGELWKCPWLGRLLRTRKLQTLTIKHALLEIGDEDNGQPEVDTVEEMHFLDCRIRSPWSGAEFANFFGEKLRVFSFCRRYRPLVSRPRYEVDSQWACVRQCLGRARRSLEVLKVSFGQGDFSVLPNADFTPFVALKRLTISAHFCSVWFPPVLKHAYYVVNGVRRELALVTERYNINRDTVGSQWPVESQWAVRLKIAERLRDKHPEAEIVLYS